MPDSSIHQWSLADDQTNTGTHGVRVWCSVHKNFLTIHRDLVENYL